MTNSKESLKSFMGRFARDEQGGIIVLTLLLLITMLVISGMAVDFMRYDSERVQLQSVSDRAVLAAADLGQTLSGEDVAVDFFRAAGLGLPDMRTTSWAHRLSPTLETNA